MTNSKKELVTWSMAFKVILGGVSKRGIPALKSLILMGALFSPPIYYLEIKQANDIISGELPPSVPLIRVTGDLIRKTRVVGLRQTPYYELHTSDGKTYIATLMTVFRGADKLAATNSLHDIYVEGFLLKNGTGAFWFTLVRLQDGELLVTPTNSLEQLKRQRTFIIPWLVGVIAILWGVSIVNLYNLKHSLTLSRG